MCTPKAYREFESLLLRQKKPSPNRVVAFLFDWGSALFSQRCTGGKHCIAHALGAGAQDDPGLDALQVLADRCAASLAEAQKDLPRIAARPLPVRQTEHTI